MNNSFTISENDCHKFKFFISKDWKKYTEMNLKQLILELKKIKKIKISLDKFNSDDPFYILLNDIKDNKPIESILTNNINKKYEDYNRKKLLNFLFKPYIESQSKKKSLKGIIGEKKGTYHPYGDYRTFLKKSIKIPQNYVEDKIDSKDISEFCGDLKIINPNDYPKVYHPKTTSYLILDNGGHPFQCYLGKDYIWVYKTPDEIHNGVVLNKDSKDFNSYNQLVYQSPIVKSWIPKGYIMYMENKSDNRYDGNNIVVQIKDDPKTFVIISSCIMQFKTISNEDIIDFWCPIGGNEVPYPTIFGQDNIYTVNGDSIYAHKNLSLKLPKERQEYAIKGYQGQNLICLFSYIERSKRNKEDPQLVNKLGKIFSKIKTKLIIPRLYG